MNLQEQLFVIYTIAFIIILLIEYFLLFGIKKIKKFIFDVFLNKNFLFDILIILLFIFIIIISILGIFITFVLCNSLAKIFVEKGQFFELQLYTNIPNYFAIYYCYLSIKEKKK